MFSAADAAATGAGALSYSIWQVECPPYKTRPRRPPNGKAPATGLGRERLNFLALPWI